MIRTKEDLRLYLQKDKEALEITRRHPRIIGDEIWKFQIALRKHEYYKNSGGGEYFADYMEINPSSAWN